MIMKLKILFVSLKHWTPVISKFKILKVYKPSLHIYLCIISLLSKHAEEILLSWKIFVIAF